MTNLILGLDLATTTGYAVFSKPLNCLESGTIKFKGEKADKILALKNLIQDILKRHPIKEAAIEDIFLPSKTSRKTPIWLGELRGVARLLCAEQQIPVSFYAPRLVKQGISGSGSSSKDDIKFILEHEFNSQFKDDNEADALAVAYYHSLRSEQSE